MMAVFILITTTIHPPEIKMSKCSSSDNFLRANSRVENKKPMVVSIYIFHDRKETRYQEKYSTAKMNKKTFCDMQISFNNRND